MFLTPHILVGHSTTVKSITIALNDTPCKAQTRCASQQHIKSDYSRIIIFRSRSSRPWPT